ncbi:MAG TPA: hypothetical protein VE596_04920 [Gaiellaceae bacterium]|nr:hypothetical protein [Gaiellaceae bacterium]
MSVPRFTAERALEATRNVYRTRATPGALAASTVVPQQDGGVPDATGAAGVSGFHAGVLCTDGVLYDTYYDLDEDGHIVDVHAFAVGSCD